jgi:hypothetical protein
VRVGIDHVGDCKILLIDIFRHGLGGPDSRAGAFWIVIKHGVDHDTGFCVMDEIRQRRGYVIEKVLDFHFAPRLDFNDRQFISFRRGDSAGLLPPNHLKLPHHFMVFVFEYMTVVRVLPSKTIELRDDPGDLSGH